MTFVFARMQFQRIGNLVGVIKSKNECVIVVCNKFEIMIWQFSNKDKNTMIS